MSFLTTTKKALRYPNLAQAADIADIVQKLAQDVDDFTAGFAQGTFASRPAAGKLGNIYRASDTGAIYLDNGTTWSIMGANNILGLLSAIPAASAVSPGTEFFATDQIAQYISDGTNWIRIGTPAGTTSMIMAATADTGYLILQGQAWPGTTGIYAALYARFGSPGVVPNMQGVTPVGFKTSDSDFGTLLATGGEKTHTLTTAELAVHAHVHNSHRHSILTTPGGGAVNTPIQGSAGASQAYQDLFTGVPGISDTTSTEQNAGSGGAHNNLQPFKVVNFQAKL